MARIPLREANALRRREAAAASVAGMAAEVRKARHHGIEAVRASVVAKVKQEADQMRADGDWSRAGPRHLVVLHAMLHEHVYGVRAAESEGKEFALAATCAARMLQRDFEGDADAMVGFLRWSWQREQDREEWRRKSGKPGGRLDWRRQFCQRGILVDYRVELERKRGRA